MIAIFIVLFVNTLYLKRNMKTYDEENNKYLNTIYLASLISFILITILFITFAIKFGMEAKSKSPWGAPVN